MDAKKILSKNIQKHLDRMGITQTKMAHDLNYPEMTVSNWMREKTYPRVDKIQEMADYFNVKRSDLTDIKDNNTISIEQYKFYPTQISAGIPNNVEAIYEQDYISLPDEIMGKYKGSKDIFVTKINGDSMNNIIKDGSFIVVKPTPLNQLKNGDIVVYSNEHEYSVKHYHKYGNTLVFKPNSINKKHKEQEYSDENKIMIHGKVVIYIVEQD